ncbi:hypothetical protein [Bernardetia sp.]|uniref:hypothetical protein n=1 Tax=Bernardetia sp. TaxID=1937974 RepID=UPI0025C38B71|nr:hypothetical protein [Bernardetia sp.]
MVTNKQQRYWKQLDREIDKVIQNKFTDSFMSNAKWVRLIDGIVENSHLFKRVEFSKVNTEKNGVLYLDEYTTYDFDYWQTGFEGCNSLGGILLYKEIEYLNFPKEFFDDKNKVCQQDLGKIKEILDSVGKFMLEVDDNYIRLIAYR